MSVFNGFKPEVIGFLSQIKQHNNKPWFDAHYDFYAKEILEKSRDLVEDLGGALLKIAPGLNVVPKVNGSIYRFARDTRFSKDKTPYKSHLSYLFWQGHLKRTRCPGFYLAILPETIRIGVGINHFAPDYLLAWRRCCSVQRFDAVSNHVRAIQHGHKARALRKMIDSLISQGLHIDGQQLKRMPRGFTIDELNQDLIRYKGLRVWYEYSIPDEVFSEDLIPYCMQYYKQLFPLFEWMVGVMSEFRIEK
jgi:uncharacterized protein (TIGR02453 family)